MPRRPNTPCKHPGCASLVPYGTSYCEKHKLLHKVEARTTTEKGYNSKWKKSRTRYLKSHPLCVQCKKEEKFVKATVVDHVIPHRGDEILFWDEGNWQALCKHCHDVKTMTEDRYQVYRY